MSKTSWAIIAIYSVFVFFLSLFIAKQFGREAQLLFIIPIVLGALALGRWRGRSEARSHLGSDSR